MKLYFDTPSEKLGNLKIPPLKKFFITMNINTKVFSDSNSCKNLAPLRLQANKVRARNSAEDV